MSTLLNDIAKLEQKLTSTMLVEQVPCAKKLHFLKRDAQQGKNVERQVAHLSKRIDESLERRSTRSASTWLIDYPEELPISQRRNDIATAITKNQVVIICGDTGSGKTTQLPKILAGLGYGTSGTIGCTQPRRLAAVSVAARVAQEMQVSLTQEVGYQVRFDASFTKKTRIKFMTDGILLAETREDKNLFQYDALIIDEAHERSLNIDFTLGYLKKVLLTRPELKVVISSATLDATSFSAFFNDAPVINVEGRTFPVEDFYLPPQQEGDDLAQQVRRGVTFIDELDHSGDILIFLPGEREIRECSDVVSAMRLRATEVLPLFGRLEMAKQQQVFNPKGSARRIILATNVAETSITIPRIRYVIDSGLVRLSRFSTKNHIQRLQIEPVSKASAQQRRGRCGRLSDGICVKLYAQQQYDDLSEFTDPEIRRTSLAGVILQMLDLSLGTIDEFPFIDPPHHRLIQAGYKLLSEIGAVEKKQGIWHLTHCGKTLARLPIDPQLGRVAIEAAKTGVLADVLPLVSFLAIQDPRERPSDNKEAADKSQQRWLEKGSDFIAILNMWNEVQDIKARESSSFLKRFYREHFLNWRRMHEWHNLHTELRTYAKDLKWKLNAAPTDTKKTIPSDQIHRALLSGIPTHVGVLEEKNEYLGMANRKFLIFPGSHLSRKKHRWIMSFALVETSQLFGRTCAEIDPAWIEEVAPHLCKYRYSAASWNPLKGAVYAKETVIAGGLTLVANRRRHYGPLAPQECREIFIREGLCEGELRTRGAFVQENKTTIDAIAKLEHKLRRVDTLISKESIVAFFDELLPPDIFTTKAFETWREKAELENKTLLYLPEEVVLGGEVLDISPESYPDTLVWQGEVFDLRYTWAPGEKDNGLVVTVDIATLASVEEPLLQWLVPGYRQELCASLLKSLPKSMRAKCVPHQNTIDAFLTTDLDVSVSLFDQLCWFLKAEKNLLVSQADFDLSRIPDHLSMKLEVVDEEGAVLGLHQDIDLLKKGLKEKMKKSFSRTAALSWHYSGMTNWDCPDLPCEVDLPGAMKGYPSLVDEGSTVGVKLCESKAEAALLHRLGQARLFEIVHGDQMDWVESQLPIDQSARVYLGLLCKGPVKGAFSHNLRLVMADKALGGSFYEKETFTRAAESARENLCEVGKDIADILKRIVSAHKESLYVGERDGNHDWQQGVADLEKQKQFLFSPHFPVLGFYETLQQYPRYLRGMLLRCSRLKQSPAKDAQKMQELTAFRDDFLVVFKKYADLSDIPPAILEFGWMLEDFRLSLLSPEVKPSQKVSTPRLLKAWHGCRDVI